jgi:hypothetical protein
MAKKKEKEEDKGKLDFKGLKDFEKGSSRTKRSKHR